MPITDQAPYGPPAGVIKVLDTYRETGLGGNAIDVGLLGRLGLGDEIARRVVMSLRLLDLIDEAGVPTRNLTAFKQAPSDSYKQVLADVLYDVYAPVFAVTGKNLADKTTAEVEDAFRTFRPDSLRKRMVSLFLGLCQYVGIVAEPPKAKPGPNKATNAARKVGTKAVKATKKGGSDSPVDPPKPPLGTLDDARQKYVDLLLAKAAEQDAPDAELLDRIERALGIAPKEASTS